MRRSLGMLLAGCVAAGIATAAWAAMPHGTPPAVTVQSEKAAAWAPPTMDAVVIVKTPLGRGTGFHIGNGMIITAAHVVEDVREVELRDNTGGTYKGSVSVVDLKTDLAIIITDHHGLAAELDCRTLAVGERITAIGNPLGLEFITAEGRIAATPRYVGTGITAYVTDIVTIMGMSGGPIFANGRVIGVNHAVMIAPLVGNGGATPSITGFGFVIPSSSVCDLVAKQWEGA